MDLSRAPFFYQAQRDHAVRVLTVPFEIMIQLAQCVTVDDEKLIHIYSMGRSGSTLASRILAQVDGVINISEPDVLTQLVMARFTQPEQQDMIKVLLDASMRLLCKAQAHTAWVIKGRSWVIELGDWLCELHPHTKNLYLYRETESWIKSNLAAFVDEAGLAAESLSQLENEVRGWMKLVVPRIAQYDPNQHLAITELLTLMWLSNMERYMALHQAGINMLAIQYPSWKQAPLEYCGRHPADMAAIEEVLKKDSQSGTSISQESVKNKKAAARLFNPVEMNRHLQRHPHICTADYQVPNTFQVHPRP